jgi:hypothetical protein
MYYLGCTGDKIWDYAGLIKHLAKMQNKDLVIQLQPEAICLQNLGLYDILDCFTFNSVTIYTDNPLETHARYTIAYEDSVGLWINHKSPTINLSNYHVWTRKKRFMCLYGRPTAGRLGIGSYVAERYSKQSHIHFSFPVTDHEYEFELDKLLTYCVDSINDVSKLLPKMPILLVREIHSD